MTKIQKTFIHSVLPCFREDVRQDGRVKTFGSYFDADCGRWEWRQYTRWVTVNYPSDGLLPQYTQELQNIPYGNKYKIDGANHMEVLNMSNSTLNGQPNDGTRKTFNKIFDRELGNFFRTDR